MTLQRNHDRGTFRTHASGAPQCRGSEGDRQFMVQGDGFRRARSGDGAIRN